MGSDLVAWVQIWWYGFRFDGMGSLLVAWVYSSVNRDWKLIDFELFG